jgi:hypothetical protein
LVKITKVKQLEYDDMLPMYFQFWPFKYQLGFWIKHDHMYNIQLFYVDENVNVLLNLFKFLTGEGSQAVADQDLEYEKIQANLNREQQSMNYEGDYKIFIPKYVS